MHNKNEGLAEDEGEEKENSRTYLLQGRKEEMRLTKTILEQFIEEEIQNHSKEEKWCRSRFSLGSWEDFIRKINIIQKASKGSLGKTKK